METKKIESLLYLANGLIVMVPLELQVFACGRNKHLPVFPMCFISFVTLIELQFVITLR